MKGLLVVLVAPSQSGKDTIAAKMVDKLNSFDFYPNATFASVYKTRSPRAEDPAYIHAVGKDGEIPIKKENQISVEIFNQTAVYDKSQIEKLLNEGKIVFVTTCSPELGLKLKAEYGEQCNTIFIRTSRRTIYNQNRDRYMAFIEHQRKNGKKLTSNETVSQEIIEQMKIRMDDFDKLRPQYEDFMQQADNITLNWWTLFMSDWSTKIDHKSEMEIERQCNKISQIFDYINQPHTETWEATECSATDEERALPPFSLDPEFVQYREEKREYN